MTALRERIEQVKAELDTAAEVRALAAVRAAGSAYRTIDMLRPERPVASRAIGLLAWSKTRRYDDDSPVGGMVVEVLVREDEGTGEIVRSYKVVDPHRDRPTISWHVLAEDEVDPDTLSRGDSLLGGHVARRLLEDAICRDRHHFRIGAFRPEHITLVALAHRLLGAL